MRAWLVILAWLVVSAGADEPTPLSVEELSRHAALVARGVVESKTVERDDQNRIFTKVKLAVGEVWKGNPKEPLLTIVHGGGVLGEEKVSALGQVEFKVGEAVVVFCVWNARGEAVVLAMAQGKFQIHPSGEAGPEVQNPYHGRPPQDRKASLAGATAPLTLEHLRKRVLAAR